MLNLVLLLGLSIVGVGALWLVAQAYHPGRWPAGAGAGMGGVW